jgi:hypothetical protein
MPGEPAARHLPKQLPNFGIERNGYRVASQSYGAGSGTSREKTHFGGLGAIAFEASDTAPSRASAEMEIMDDSHPSGSSVSDALIHWTTAGGLIAFGVIFFDDAVIMGRTILTLGILSATNEGLKLLALRAGSDGGYRRVRLVLAIAYVALVLIGFLFPPSEL